MLMEGLFAAVWVTLFWVSTQWFVMHFKPAKNRFKAMLMGYLISLPFVYIDYACVTSAWPIPRQLYLGWQMGLFHAYLFHLLLFFLYVECFYHVERSVTLRFLVEILNAKKGEATMENLTKDYDIYHMISTRLTVLEANEYIEKRHGKWHLLPKGQSMAKAMRVSQKIFQSDPQSERL